MPPRATTASRWSPSTRKPRPTDPATKGTCCCGRCRRCCGGSSSRGTDGPRTAAQSATRSDPSAAQVLLQPALRGRPLAVEDAEVDRVAQVAVAHDDLGAQGAFFDGAEAENGGTRPGVAGVGLELDADAAEPLERVGE